MLEIKTIKKENGELGISFVIQTSGIRQKHSDVVSVFRNTENRISQRLKLFRIAFQILRADPESVLLEKKGKQNQLSFAWKDSSPLSLRGTKHSHSHFEGAKHPHRHSEWSEVYSPSVVKNLPTLLWTRFRALNNGISSGSNPQNDKIPIPQNDKVRFPRQGKDRGFQKESDQNRNWN